ncbi:sugar-binding domain-containing protein [Conexibacter stalactiti]|uniref:Glycoside hydrolase family 2 TIM barrel-domain containing protein n=1 Tax=Conexibacter stalactiti TaxID=1940611 RepID=A0ABU4HQ23_9ACTN|nr:sugar-binding domain-containing protein [Conexibacter stalactiti]MDW5595412.1 glycoside hydrolase family 2 TIM barrel-domain containing protein [Conexibacter stalactiti]MEC5036054.1 sugar-binding domain-containing protein [Conexibacter stalactiti]
MTTSSTAAQPRLDYPRPDFDRSQRWASLDGSWRFAADPDDHGRAAGWANGAAAWDGAETGEIVVPSCWESAASGVGREWLPVGWYARTLQRPASWPAHERTIVRFGAVHHAASVWCGGVLAGEHVGGSVPFELDVSELLGADGAAELVVRVEAPLDKGAIAHGKQRSRPADPYDSCAFTASSGIWQSVWLESRPATHVAHVALRPDAQLGGFDVTVELAGPALAEATLTLALSGADDQAAVTLPAAGAARVEAHLPIADPRLWSPDDPHLYRVEARLSSVDGEDRVTVHGGLRRIEVDGERLLLNGGQLYVRGVLDQGYWPDSGLTPPNAEALRRDLELARAAGFNLVRKHIKLEDPRWLHMADQMGMLVWAEPPCTSRWSEDGAAAFEAQIEPMVRRDGNHPSIVIWGLYNEEWGLDWDVAGDPAKQEAVRRARRQLLAFDDTRPVVDDSGWAHVETDLVDWHRYEESVAGWRAHVAGIADGSATSFPVNLGPDHVQEMHLGVPGARLDGLPLLNSEFGGGEFDPAGRGWHLRWQTQELRRHDRLAGYVYTELCDVEHELAGVYDERRRLKPALDCDLPQVLGATTLVIDLDPLRPGLDVETADGAVRFPVALSHHGTAELAGELRWGWEGVDAGAGAVPIAAQPFRLGAPVEVAARLPDGVERGRLLLRVIDGDGHERTGAFVDVGRDA